MPCLHLNFLRHGATEPNLQGLRCGGDLDVPLTELGRQQAVQAALRILELRLSVGLIVTSRMRRTAETAQIVSRLLNGVPVAIEPAFAERRLGQWNLKPIAQTQDALVRGETPPGGEANREFLDRIASAVQALLPRLDERPLLVGSKGVARALHELARTGQARGSAVANGQLAHFDLSHLVRHREAVCPS
jgi:2,3-bisphosphoglycerate-dependent phosphoglycerate mutase